jgi:PHS family inorganic phosphate transporter-like MFS transporter
MSSSLSAEKSPLGSRAVLILAVFSFIGLGTFSASVVYLILLYGFKNAMTHDIVHLQWVWRLLLGLGLIPAALTLYARLTIRETEPYEKCEAV